MSIQPAFETIALLSDEAVATLAAELEELRMRVTAVQAEGRLEPELLAQFADAQRAFLAAKIQLEQARQEVWAAEQTALEQAAVEATLAIQESLASRPPVTVEVSPATQRGGKILGASRVFWLVLMLLLTALLWFEHSSFARQ